MLPRRRIPQHHSILLQPATPGKGLSIRAERHAIDLVYMTAKCLFMFPRRRIPEPHRPASLFIAKRGAVRTEYDILDLTRISGERPLSVPTSRYPITAPFGPRPH